jgi:hypothetical protein
MEATVALTGTNGDGDSKGTAFDDEIFGFRLIGTAGNSIALQEFRIGAAAQDADGTGGAAAVQFATLSPGLALTNGLIGII